jgi:proline racemase
MTALPFRAVSTVDYHTGGEPFRIVAAPPVDLPGSTVAERRVCLPGRGPGRARDLAPGQALVHDSIVGSTFRCTVVDSLTADGHPAVIPQVTGMAYRCGTSEFTFDPRDPFVPGFVLR